MTVPSLRPLAALAAVLAAFFLSACSPLALVDELVPETGYKRETGIAYGSGARQKLDVYRPAQGLESKTVIVFLYGGSWRSGARRHYRFVGQTLASRGHLVVIPDYRLYPQVRFPEFVEDAAAAIAWVHRRIAEYGGDPDRIVLAGHSAGAHMAALVALDRRYLRDAGVPHSAIAGWVGLAGPYAFDPLKYSRIQPIFETAANPDAARPVTFARPGAPPALLIHGTDDGTVKPENSAELARRLRAAGVAARYLPLPDIGHSGVLLALAKPFRSRAPVAQQVADFIAILDDRSAARSD